jgi:hypothetical protein
MDSSRRRFNHETANAKRISNLLLSGGATEGQGNNGDVVFLPK